MQTPRVSLAEVAEQAGRPLRRASSETLDAGVPPTLQDLAESLFFTPGDGRIWLNDQRMILLHTASLGALRRELIESFGTEKARGLLTRIGYTSGARDAQVIRRRWPDGDLASAFNAGPRLHSLEGVVKVTPVHFAFDVDRGSFMGEFLWHDSMEAAEHIAAYGIGTAPACWMQIGYASGYASAFLGKLIVYREIQCAAMGASCCRIVGRPVDEWENAEDDLRYFNVAEVPGATAPHMPAVASVDRVASPALAGEWGTMVGISPAFRAARHMLERVARSSATVLFTGESGVGKELFSRALHAVGARAAGPFVAVNCAAIPDTLLEAELFGVERGAYTGAITSRQGRFERASGGTLFLDEIASLSLTAQGKLLRVLQEGEVERVGGGGRSIKVDVRVVAASYVDLREEVRAGRFRDDLYFRLNVFPIELPPLRDRRDDIPLLMEHFLTRYVAKHGRQITGFTRRSVEALLNYEYPGNIRELQNLIERGVIYAEDGEAIDVVHMFRSNEQLQGGAFALSGDGALRASSGRDAGEAAPGADGPRQAGEPGQVAALALDAGLSLADLQQRLFSEALARCDGNVSRAARLLGVTRAQLDYRLSKRQAK